MRRKGDVYRAIDDDGYKLYSGALWSEAMAIAYDKLAEDTEKGGTIKFNNAQFLADATITKPDTLRNRTVNYIGEGRPGLADTYSLLSGGTLFVFPSD